MRAPSVVALLFYAGAGAIGTPAHAQAPPDAGALRRQIERELTPPLPGSDTPLRTAEPAPPAAPEGVSLTVKSFRFAGNTLLRDEQLQTAVQPWLDRPLGFADLQRATQAVANAFRAAGWIVSARLPQQDVTEGVVTIEITESRFAGARIEDSAARRLEPKIALEHVSAQQRSGQPLAAAALDRALLLVNDLPGISAAGALAPGREPGETELLLRLTDERGFDKALRIDNAGAAPTGDERAVLTMSVNSPRQIGDRLRADLLHSEGSDYLRLAYGLPVGADGWLLGVSASRFDYDLVDSRFAALDGEGSSSSVGVDAHYPLLRSRLRNLYLTFGADERRFRNDALGMRQSDYAITAWTTGLTGNLYDGWGGGGVNSFTLSWAGGRLRQGTLDFAENPQLRGSFDKLVYSVSRQQALTPTLSLYGALTGQYSDELLDSSERYYLGGPAGVRAYPVNDGGGSRSRLVTLELRWLIRPALTATVFDDRGRADDPGGEPAYTLRGHGLSLAWRAPRGIQVEMTYARRNGRNPDLAANDAHQESSRDRNRWWIGASRLF